MIASTNEYDDETFMVMLHQESTTYNNSSSSSSSSSKNNETRNLAIHGHNFNHEDLPSLVIETSQEERIHKETIKQWRKLIVQWMYEIVRCYRLSPTIVAVASYYLDTAVSKGIISRHMSTCQSLDYQIVALASFGLALKCYDVRAFSLTQLIQWSQGTICKQDLITMEWKLLKTLNFQVHPPTANCFLNLYLCSLHDPTKQGQDEEEIWRVVRDGAEKMIQYAILSGNFSDYPPSLLAMTCVAIVIHKLVRLQTCEEIRILMARPQVQDKLAGIQRIVTEKYSIGLMAVAIAELEPLCCMVDRRNIQDSVSDSPHLESNDDNRMHSQHVAMEEDDDDDDNNNNNNDDKCPCATASRTQSSPREVVMER